MININDDLTTVEPENIIRDIFRVKGEIQTNDCFGFVQAHFNVRTLSANKIRQINETLYRRTGAFPNWDTMLDSTFTLDNPTILVHLTIIFKS